MRTRADKKYVAGDRAWRENVLSHILYPIRKKKVGILLDKGKMRTYTKRVCMKLHLFLCA